jgi:hypothetical protein
LEADRKFILDNLQITVPDSKINAYKELILKNQEVFRKNNLDIGLANNFEHRIHMKNKEAVYIPQFRIADAYREGLHAQVKDLLKMGVVQPSHSLYNSPIFVVPKKMALPGRVVLQGP